MTTLNCDVADLELGPVIAIAPTTTLSEAAAVLAASGAGTLVVESHPLTEITEHDIVAAVARGTVSEATVAEIRRSVPEFVASNSAVGDVAAVMFASGRRTVVVVHNGQPVGIVGLRSVMSALLGTTSWLGAFHIALSHEGT